MKELSQKFFSLERMKNLSLTLNTEPSPISGQCSISIPPETDLMTLSGGIKMEHRPKTG